MQATVGDSKERLEMALDDMAGCNSAASSSTDLQQSATRACTHWFSDCCNGRIRNSQHRALARTGSVTVATGAFATVSIARNGDLQHSGMRSCLDWYLYRQNSNNFCYASIRYCHSWSLRV